MVSLLILIVGVIFLVFGANFLVDGASVVAKKFNIPNIVIGLTIVAFGTSSPEFVVNVISSTNEKSAITLGNVLGSNIINVLVILGITAIICPLIVGKNTIRYEIPITILTAIVTYILSKNGVINRVDGYILFGLFILFLLYNTYLILKNKEESEIEIKKYGLLLSIILIIIGLLFLILGGKFIVNSAVNLARNFGISERVISITIVSLGTSLPELATSVAAAVKKNSDMAIGNIVGSNIFNTLVILGISSIINPIEVPVTTIVDFILNIACAVLLLMFVFKGYVLKRYQGIIFLGIYLGYMFLLFR